MRHRPTIFELLALSGFFILLNPPSAAASPATVATAGDASISKDASDGTWTLSAGGSSLTLVLDPSREFATTRLATSSGSSWTVATIADSTVTIDGQVIAIGSRAAGFSLLDTSVDAEPTRLQLNATFELRAANLRLTRHYAIASGAPAFEAWTTYAPGTGTPVVSNLNGLQLAVTNGTIRSLTGLQGDTADVQSDGAFTLQQRALAVGERFAIGSEKRASETTIPWIAIDGARDEFFAAVMWSGSWALTADRNAAGLSLNVSLPGMSTTVRTEVDGPHVVFGVVPGALADATAALRTYALQGIRGGRPLSAPVIYNTWFAYGTEVDEASMRAEMERVAALGAELFVLDAGWYEGTGAAGPSDFDAGLGSWVADPARFPNGLRPLRDYAHSLGLKFGIWVEPERVNLSLVGAPGVEDIWLAMQDGQYGSEDTAQICFSHKAAKAFVLAWLTKLLDDLQPDYLKWDNNMWVNCNRSGHDHGATDGNFAHVTALYEILAAIHSRYPDLLVENVSGGGNRLDLGMLRYTDVAWMDDRTAPSVNVRHNIEGLSAVFPPAYLLSFVTNHESESLHDARDMQLYVRSRMGGVLGLCFRSDELGDADAATLAREIALYKAMRETLSVAAGHLLTDQAQAENGPAWDVLQATAEGNQQALICAYQTDDGVKKINVKPVGLQSNTTYLVQSADTGVLGATTGSELMANGVDIVQSPNTAAHILIIRTKQ